jgi:glycosyltransferase involved in cell wall biosynthesis
VVVHVASFTPKKRHEDLLAAAGILLADRGDVTFLLVGDGPLRGQMEAKAREMGLGDRVRFLGYRTDAVRVMAAGDLFVLSSQFEGLPIALLEAMALGLPVVATRAGAIPEVVINEEHGLLVDALSPASLAAGMSRALADRDLQERLSRNACERVRSEFGIDAMVRKTEELYNTVLAAKGVAHG